jgi:hypothetical protein
MSIKVLHNCFEQYMIVEQYFLSVQAQTLQQLSLIAVRFVVIMIVCNGLNNSLQICIYFISLTVLTNAVDRTT